MPKKEPNWSIFYQRLCHVGPKMLKNIPKKYLWWVEELAVTTDKFGVFTQDAFYTWWSEDQRQAIIETIDRWGGNVQGEMDFMADIWETDPREISRLRKQIQKIKLNLDDKLIDFLLEGAHLPLDTPEENEDAIIKKLNELIIPVGYLDFELLPKESSDINGIISHLRGIQAKGISNYHGQIIDVERLENIRSLNPEKCYIGEDRWKGYVLFDFPKKNKAILECPVVGNATYILSGDWREMVKHSRYHIRLHFKNRHKRIIHKGDWLDKVRNHL